MDKGISARTSLALPMPNKHALVIFILYLGGAARIIEYLALMGSPSPGTDV